MAGSLIVSGFVQYSFSRYVADQVYSNRGDFIIPSFHGVMLSVSTIAGGLSFFFILFFFPMQSIAYRFLFMGCFVILCNVWVLVNLLTGLKDYRIIVIAFLVSYGLIVTIGFILCYKGLEGLMLGYFLGQLCLIMILMSAFYKQYPTNRVIDFLFFKKNQIYQGLMVSGLLLNLAIWVDKFVFWYAPITGTRVIGPLHASLFYDAPIFIAYLTAVPGMGVLVFLMETNFSEYYQRFHEAIRDGKPLRYIKKMREQMVTHAYDVIYSVIKIQAVVIIIVFQMGENILTLFHISPVYKNLLFVDVIGTSLQIVFLAILNLLYYMDKRDDALLISALFLILNLSLSILTIYLGPFYYGFGFTLALIVTCMYGMHLLEKEFCNHSPQSAPAGRAVVMKPLQHKIVITLYKKIQQAASHQITFLKHPLALLHVFEL